jgi:hypothetical protein
MDYLNPGKYSDIQKFYITRVEYLNTLINYFRVISTKDYETQEDTVITENIVSDSIHVAPEYKNMYRFGQ